jgi:death on curing protein
MTIWQSRELVLAMHEEQLAEHGGALGIRDEGLLESALARPLNRAGYGEPDVVELGALYAMAIARNHPFVDGNKRAAFMALVTFFALNGVAFSPSEAEAAVQTLAMAAGELSEDEFIVWLREHARVPD